MYQPETYGVALGFMVVSNGDTELRPARPLLPPGVK